MVNEIIASPELQLLVLDDYHLIQSTAIHDSLMFLIDHLPPNFRLVILSRSDPPLSLALLRARGQLIEVRIADLRFTPEEMACYLQQSQWLALSARDLAVLENLTEGWITGLQLAALSLQGHEDPSGFIQAFPGSHTYVLDYLVEEVIHHLPLETRDFMLRTCLLERLSAPLCQSMMEAPEGDSQAVLEHLNRSNLFLIALDQERC